MSLEDAPSPLSPQDQALTERELLRERLLAEAPSESKMRQELVHTLATMQWQQEERFNRMGSLDERNDALAKARLAYRIGAEVAQMDLTTLQEFWLRHVQGFES